MKNQEDKLQKQCYIWFHNTYPDHRNLLCYNFNNTVATIPAEMKTVLQKHNILELCSKIMKKTAIVRGSSNRAMGLTKGRSDMVLYYKGRATMIEFKTETGKQSKEQKQWQKDIQLHNFNYEIIRSFEDFKEIIKNIL